MLKWYFLFLFILISFAGNSQISIKQGEWTHHKNALTHQGFLFADSLFTYSIDYQSGNFLSGPKLLANQFDKKTQAFVKNIDLSPQKKDNNEIKILQIFSLENNFITVYTLKPNVGDKRLVLEKISGSGQHIKTVEFDFKSYENNLNENVEVLTDKLETRMVICNNIPPTAENDQELTITTLDSDLNSLWVDTVKFPNRDQQFLLSDWKFDGKNRLFFIGRHISNLFQPDMAYSSLKENSQFLFGYNHETGKLREVELSLNQRFINKTQTELDANQWIIAGTFSTDKTFRLDGVFSLILNLDMETQTHTIHDFTASEQKLFTTLSQVDKKKKFSDELVLKSIQIMDNGEFALIGEEYRKEWQEPMESRMSSNNFTEVFYYQNILVFWFNKKGIVSKVSNVPKNQVSANDGGRNSSFHVSNTGEKLLFFYNDNPKNRELTDVTAPLKTFTPNKKGYVNCTEINSGSSRIETIIVPTTRHIKMQPVKASFLLDDITYFLREKRRRMALIMVVTKE